MWIINTLLSWLVDVICRAFQFLVECFLNMFGMDGANTLNLFHYVFPFTDTVWNVCMYAGFFVLFIITVWQVFKAMFGNLTEAESPTKTIAKMIITAGFVGFSGTLCKIFFYIGTVPFEAFMNASDSFTDFSETWDDLMAMDSPLDAFTASTTFADSAMILTGVSGLLPFIFIVAFSVLMQEFFKLMCEAVERYVILGILSMFAPVCISTGVSKSTQRICFSWVNMMISQTILMSMNVIFLKGFCSGISRMFRLLLGTTAGTGETGLGTDFTFFTAPVAWLMVVAWLKVGQRMDEYMNMLGMTAAISGGGFGAGILGGIDRGVRDANPWYNNAHNTQFGRPGAPRSPFSFGALLGSSRQRKQENATVNGGPRMTTPSKWLDSMAKRSKMDSRDLNDALAKGQTFRSKSTGEAAAKAYGIDAKGLGKLTDACTFNGRNGTFTLEGRDANGNITRATYAVGPDGKARLTNAEGKNAATMCDHSVDKTFGNNAANLNSANNIAAAANVPEGQYVDANGNIYSDGVFDKDNGDSYDNLRTASGRAVDEKDIGFDSQGNLIDKNTGEQVYGDMKNSDGSVTEGIALSDSNTQLGLKAQGENSIANGITANDVYGTAVFDANNNAVAGATHLDENGNAVNNAGEIVRSASEGSPMHEGLATVQSLKDTNYGESGHLTEAATSSDLQGFIHSGQAVPGAVGVNSSGNAIDYKGNEITDKFGQAIKAEQDDTGTITSTANNVMMSEGTAGCSYFSADGKAYDYNDCSANVSDKNFAAMGRTAYVAGTAADGTEGNFRITQPEKSFIKDGDSFIEDPNGTYKMNAAPASEGQQYFEPKYNPDNSMEVSTKSSSVAMSNCSRLGDESAIDTNYIAAGTSKKVSIADTDVATMEVNGRQLQVHSNSISNGHVSANDNGSISFCDPDHEGNIIRAKPDNDTVYMARSQCCGGDIKNGSAIFDDMDIVSYNDGRTVTRSEGCLRDMYDTQTLPEDQITKMENNPAYTHIVDKDTDMYMRIREGSAPESKIWSQNVGETLTGERLDRFKERTGLAGINADEFRVRDNCILAFSPSRRDENGNIKGVIITADNVCFDNSSKKTGYDGFSSNATPCTYTIGGNNKVEFTDAAKAKFNAVLAKTGDSRPDKVSTIISSKRIVPTSFDREKLKTPYPRRRDDDWDEDDL